MTTTLGSARAASGIRSTSIPPTTPSIAPTTAAAAIPVHSTTAPTTAIVGVTPTTNAVFGCSAPASPSSSLTPTISSVVNPDSINYAASGSFQILGTNLTNITEELLCPTQGTSGSSIILLKGPFSYSGTQANIYVPSGLVSGGIYDVRLVGNGLISGVSSSDRLFVADVLVGSAGA